jgi:hypothetical protein
MRSVVRNPGLGSRLKAYRESVRSRPEIDWTAKLGSWPTYAAAAGSALAMATGASANTIQYSGIQNVTVAQAVQTQTNNRLAPGDFLNFDIDGLGHNFGLLVENFRDSLRCPNGVLAVGPTCTTSLGNSSQAFVQGGNHLAILFAPSSGVVFDTASSLLPLGEGAGMRNFNLGDNIGGQDGRGVLRASTAGQGVRDDHFVAGQAGFGGIRLGANEYGWVRLRLTNDQAGHVQSMTAIDWAINTNGGILAGQTSNESSPTPEPNSGAMALLAAGSAGVLAWRRRLNAGD